MLTALSRVKISVIFANGHLQTSVTRKISTLCPNAVLDARLKVSSLTKARHLAKGSEGFLLSFFVSLATHRYLFNVCLHLYPPIPLMLIFLMELLFRKHVLFIAG